MLPSGTLIHQRYQVLQQIGIGGMGAVYKALDTRLQHAVALKHMLVSPSHEQVAAFRREAQLLARLRHPALPKVHDHFVEPYGHFLVMEYIDGQDLSALLQASAGPFEVARVLGWADRLLDALTYLHTQQPAVIHRDIKPQNLKLDRDDRVLLLDFGLAKGAPSSLAPDLSGVSVFGYTLQYAPFEQIQGSGTDARSDLYALAATLYHLLAGVPPPNALTRASAMLASQEDPLLPLQAHNPRVPAAVDRALRQALAIRAEDRWASAADLQSALRAAELPQAGVQVRVVGERLDRLEPAASAAEPGWGRASLGITHAIAPVVEPAAEAPEPPRPGARRGLLAYALPLLLALMLLGVLLAPSASRPRLIAGGALTFVGLAGALAVYDRIGRRYGRAGVLGSHPDTVLALAIAPRGRLVASAANDGSIMLWQLGSRELHASCRGHRGPVRQLGFTLDGRTLISASDDGTLRLWQARDGGELHTLAGHTGRVYQLAVAPDGHTLASASEDGTVRLWRVREGSPLHTLAGHAAPVLGLAFAPDGALIATAGEDGLVRLWRAGDGKLLHVLSGHAGAACAVAFSPDGRTLASCSRDCTVRLWQVRDGTQLQILRGHGLAVGGVAFHPGGAVLASRSEDATVRLWRVRDGAPLHTLAGHARAVSAIAFAQRGDTLASASWDGTLRLWRVRDGQQQAELAGHAARIFCLAAFPDGQALVSGGLDRTVRFWPL